MCGVTIPDSKYMFGKTSFSLLFLITQGAPNCKQKTASGTLLVVALAIFATVCSEKNP